MSPRSKPSVRMRRCMGAAVTCVAVAGFAASTGAIASGPKLPAAASPAWKSECGSCHVAYPPGLLPAASWRAVMAGLDRHFDTDATIDAPTATAIEACEAAWEYFGGIFKVVIPDNTKTIVNEADPLEPKLVPGFLEYAQSRGFLVDPTRKRSPKDKARVERTVQTVADDCFGGETLTSIEQARDHARRWGLEEYGRRRHSTTQRMPLEHFEAEERAELADRHGDVETVERVRWQDHRLAVLAFERPGLDARNARGGKLLVAAGAQRRRRSDLHLAALLHDQNAVLVGDLDRLHDLALAQHRIDVGLRLLLERHRREQVAAGAFGATGEAALRIAREWRNPTRRSQICAPGRRANRRSEAASSSAASS